jgi:arylsulfatase A-like enzyme
MISRRKILLGAGALASLPVLAGCGGNSNRKIFPDGPPNILWFISDDANPYIGAYGDALARTPNIDQFAKTGILYRNVFSNAPVCAPTRFSLLTGMLPESCGPAHHMRAVAKLPDIMRTVPEYLRAKGYYCTNNWKTDYNTNNFDESAIWDASSRTAHWRTRPEGKPFYSVITSLTTHESSLTPLLGTVTEGSVKPDQVRVPAFLPDTPEVRRDIASYYNRMERMDAELATVLQQLQDDGLAENTIVFYFSDNGGVLPRSKRFLYDEGLRSPLIVRVPDRWKNVIPTGTATDVTTPVSFIDFPPTLLALAGLTAPSHMQGKPLLSALDTYGSGSNVARATRYVFGMRNRMDERTDFSRSVTDGTTLYIRHYMPHRPWGLRNEYSFQLLSYQSWETEHLAGRLNAAQDLFWQQKPYEEFYDLRADRDQVNNLIADPARQAKIAEMRVALDEHMLDVNDNGFIPESAAPEGWEASRVPGAYPLRRVMDLASLAAQRQPASLPVFRNASRDSNALVRHWAAQGLLMLGENARGGIEDLERLLDDELPQTRVVAGEALIKLVPGHHALDLLVELLESHPLPRVRLHAVEALTQAGTLALPAVERIRLATIASKDEFVIEAAVYLVLVLKGLYRPGIVTYGGAGLALLRTLT